MLPESIPPCRTTAELSPSQRRSFELDLAFEILAATLKPWQRMTLNEIAAFVGVSHQRIGQIERSALRKLRKLCKAKGIESDVLTRHREATKTPIPDYGHS